MHTVTICMCMHTHINNNDQNKQIPTFHVIQIKDKMKKIALYSRIPVRNVEAIKERENTQCQVIQKRVTNLSYILRVKP